MPPKAKTAAPAGEISANPQDETLVRQAAVVSSTFANVELQTTRQTLKQYTQLYDEAREENQRLMGELVERDKDSMKVVQFLRAELDAKAIEVQNMHKQHKADLDKVRTDFHGERKQLLSEINERDDEINNLQNQNTMLQGDLDALKTFAHERDNLHKEMLAFREHHKKECDKYEAEIARLRFVSLEEKVRVKAEERILTEKFEAEVADRAMKLLDVKTKDIHNENFALLQDKVLLEQELDRLAAENKTVKITNSTQKREVELAKVADEEYSKRGAKQSREIKDLRNQVKLMETNISKLIDDYEHKLDVQLHTSQAEIDKLKEERDLAYRNAELRHKELIKMRQLSKTIVRQRGELEIFFNEALDYVRQQILAERQLAIQESLQQRYGGGTSGKTQTAVSSSVASTKLLESGGGKPKAGALVASDHPFFSGAKEFDSIYQMNEEGALASKASSANGGRRPSGGGLPAIKPPSATAVSSAGLPKLASSTARSTPSGPLPPTAGSALNATTDIAHLSWPDKERVLRILLAKINNAARYERRQESENAQGDGLHVLIPSAPQQLITDGKSETFLTQQ